MVRLCEIKKKKKLTPAAKQQHAQPKKCCRTAPILSRQLYRELNSDNLRNIAVFFDG